MNRKSIEEPKYGMIIIYLLKSKGVDAQEWKFVLSVAT